MNYELNFTDAALKDLALLKRNEPTAYKKALKLLDELRLHPTTGTGRPEQLKGNRAGQWSRRINSKHLLVYTINNGILTVIVLAASGHYDDK